METQTLEIPTLNKSKISGKKSQRVNMASSCCTPKQGDASACCTPSKSPEENSGACCAQPEDGSACCNK